MVADLSTAGLAPATVHKAYQTLSKAMRSAVDAELLAARAGRPDASP